MRYSALVTTRNAHDDTIKGYEMEFIIIDPHTVFQKIRHLLECEDAPEQILETLLITPIP